MLSIFIIGTLSGIAIASVWHRVHEKPMRVLVPDYNFTLVQIVRGPDGLDPVS